MIDAARFVALTAAVAGCAPSGRSAKSAPVVDVPARTERDGEGETPREELAADPSCDPEAGDVRACVEILPPAGPACESWRSLKHECESLDRGFLQPRVAAAIAGCLARHSRTRSICRWETISECALDAYDAACVDVEANDLCHSAARACSRSGKELAMPFERCVRTLSAMTGDNRRHQQRCLADACAPDYCFPFQPYLDDAG